LRGSAARWVLLEATAEASVEANSLREPALSRSLKEGASAPLPKLGLVREPRQVLRTCSLGYRSVTVLSPRTAEPDAEPLQAQTEMQ